MSFMDKVKQQAEQAMVKAQAGVAQGQAKLATVNTAKQNNDMLRDLGAAFYAQQRQGGSPDAVAVALAALDAAAQSEPIDLTPSAAQVPSPAQDPQAASQPPPVTSSGDFTL